MNQKELLLISVCIFLTIIAWVMIEVFQVQNTTALERTIELPAIPQNKINVEIFDTLKNKKP